MTWSFERGSFSDWPDCPIRHKDVMQMLETGFLALALATQAGPVDALQPAVLPKATCVCPAAKSTMPASTCAGATTSVVDAAVIKDHLQKWERAAHPAEEWSRSQLEEFRRRLHEDFNQHAAAAAEQLMDHTSATLLMESFSWHIVERRWGQVCLEAVPKDETERLFYSSLRIWLSTDDAVPQRLAIVGRNRVAQTIWQAQSSPSLSGVQLVQFEQTVPPAPTTALKTTGGRFD